MTLGYKGNPIVSRHLHNWWCVNYFYISAGLSNDGGWGEYFGMSLGESAAVAIGAFEGCFDSFRRLYSMRDELVFLGRDGLSTAFSEETKMLALTSAYHRIMFIVIETVYIIISVL